MTDQPVHDDRVARLERALSGSQDGFWERNLRTQQSWYSDSFRALFGFAPDELPNDREAVNARIHCDDIGPFLAAYDEAIRTLQPFSYQLRFLDKHGRWRWVRGRGRVWAGADGRAEIIAGATSDITDERQAGLRRHEADRANAAKSRFLAHMSHEIRTPLNGLLGLTDLALREAESPSQRRHLEVALQSGQALLQVISDVLEVSRAESGPITPAHAPFDLADALAEAMRGVMPLVRGKGLALRYDWIGPRTWVSGDVARVRQIVTHLLGNAAKFTQAGHIALVTEMVEAGDGRCVATVRVEDTGPGLDADMAARVFDAFVQGDASLSRRHGGTGLGLAIARGLARGLGGDITLCSVPGQGSTFTLMLPLASAGDPHPSLPQAPCAELAAAGREAWLLYRNDAAAAWMQRRLARIGWRVRVLPGIDAAIAHATGTQSLPQMVLVPESVLAADADLQSLRSALPAAAITLLVHGDWDDARLERTALSLGMTLALSPLTPRDLALLGRPGETRAGTAPARLATPAALSAAPPGHVLLVEDNPVNRLIGIEILKTLGVPVQTADDGAAALTACETQAPALVLMDLQMPVMDGLETTRRLRVLQGDGRLPNFPIVALTAHAMDGDREQALAAGIDAYLTKPILLDALRGELARWLPVVGNA